MSVYYVDTSAAIKLLFVESHSKSFAEFYDENLSASWVSSALLRVELLRAVHRALPTAVPDAQQLFLALDFIGIHDDIIDAATDEPDRMLRSLDAIHLATARTLGSDLDGMVTYDDRIAVAASAAGMTIISPRD